MAVEEVLSNMADDITMIHLAISVQDSVKEIDGLISSSIVTNAATKKNLDS